MDPVAVHLKDIDQREVKVIEEVVNDKIGAEGMAIVVLGDCPLIGDIAFFGQTLAQYGYHLGNCLCRR